MIAAEFLALVVLLFGGGIGVKLAWSAVTRASQRDIIELQRRAQMRRDLHVALSSGDYRRLDDFLLVWANDMDQGTWTRVKERRDQMFVDSNP